jgi:hypothetical protein
VVRRDGTGGVPEQNADDSERIRRSEIERVERKQWFDERNEQRGLFGSRYSQRKADSESDDDQRRPVFDADVDHDRCR